MKDNSILFHEAPSIEVQGESGCFTNVDWKAGSVLEKISQENALKNLMHIDDFIPNSCHPSSRFCYRFCGDLVYFSPEARIITDYINHSQNPNVVIYMGITVALRDIKAGEELLADYRFLMHKRFSMDCGDYSVTGFDASEADLAFMEIMTGIKDAII